MLWLNVNLIVIYLFFCYFTLTWFFCCLYSKVAQFAKMWSLVVRAVQSVAVIGFEKRNKNNELASQTAQQQNSPLRHILKSPCHLAFSTHLSFKEMCRRVQIQSLWFWKLDRFRFCTLQRKILAPNMGQERHFFFFLKTLKILKIVL